MEYKFFAGNIFFPGLKTNERFSTNNLGKIVVGGDRGDVWATSAEMTTQNGEAGVLLIDAELRTSLALTEFHDVDFLREEIESIIRACYESIQEETFAQIKKYHDS